MNMLRRVCAAPRANGRPCKAAPLTSGNYCLMHDPEHAAEVAEGRKLGGYRRKREAAVIGAYDLEGMDSVTFLQRVLEIALLDTLGTDNTLNRSRTLGYLVGMGTKLRQEGETELRLAALEAAVHGRKALPEQVFDVERDSDDVAFDVE